MDTVHHFRLEGVDDDIGSGVCIDPDNGGHYIRLHANLYRCFVVSFLYIQQTNEPVRLNFVCLYLQTYPLRIQKLI